MAKFKSDEKRDAILSAAIAVIAAQGLSASTASIAKAAGVANGSLFIYFPTKVDLLNAVYVDLKAQMADAALDGRRDEADLRDQLFLVWSNWVRWAASNPDKRRALAHLAVSDDVTPLSRRHGHETMAGAMDILERLRADGPMASAPASFVATLMNAMAEATIDVMITDPANAEQRCTDGFEAIRRMIT